MNFPIKLTEEKIIEITQNALGKKISEIINVNFENDKNKGAIGNLIQSNLFGIKNNNRREPDFIDLKMELKVIPVINRKRSFWEPKERLVITNINYKEDHKFEFEESHLFKKIKKLFIIQYEHNYKNKYDSKIVDYFIHEFNDKDLKIIKKDYKTIINKIKIGKAEEISEADTEYLSACRKGAGKGNDLKQQAFSSIKAKSRAFSLKQSYLKIINKKRLKHLQEIFTNEELKKSDHSIVEALKNKIKKYIGESVENLYKLFEIKTSKHKNRLLVEKMLGLKNNKKYAKELELANIKIKTIRIIDRKMKEDISFKAIDFNEVHNENWNNYSLKTIFEESKFAFFIFEGNEKNNLFFKDIKIWSMPQKDISEYGKIYNNLKRLLKEKNIVSKVNGKYKNKFPKIKDNFLGHVRPHARNNKDTIILPNGEKTPKQSFWLNRKYIIKQINDSNKISN